MQLIYSEKFRIVRNKIPRQVRSELLKSVKSGLLGHVTKKETGRYEVFYDPHYKRLAYNAVEEEAKAIAKALSRIIVK